MLTRLETTKTWPHTHYKLWERIHKMIILSVYWISKSWQLTYTVENHSNVLLFWPVWCFLYFFSNCSVWFCTQYIDLKSLWKLIPNASYWSFCEWFIHPCLFYLFFIFFKLNLVVKRQTSQCQHLQTSPII